MIAPLTANWFLPGGALLRRATLMMFVVTSPGWAQNPDRSQSDAPTSVTENVADPRSSGSRDSDGTDVTGNVGVSPDTPAASPTPANPPRPGLLHELGQALEGSLKRFNSDLRKAGKAFGNLGQDADKAVRDTAGATRDAADLAKSAVDDLVTLPNQRIVIGRARCTTAANGAPDCRSAAVAVCRGKGFGDGASLEVESAEKCPSQVWLSGRAPRPGECQVETYVTRAACR